VHELLRTLPPGSRVLDLGCAAGSFVADGDSLRVTRIDLERDVLRPPHSVQADAARLPFRDACFDAIISNHSLEHFDNLPASLNQIGRVLKPDGVLYVAVPDASTFSDRLYRWLARGGGHVNAFRSAAELAAQIELATGCKHVATRTLCTSLSWLNRKNRRAKPPRRLLFLGGGTQLSLLLFNYLARLSDRFLATRLSVYGWVLYFGNVRVATDCELRTDVCVRCGSGHASNWLLHDCKLVRRTLGFLRTYRCPGCGALNLFTDDRHYQHLAKIA